MSLTTRPASTIRFTMSSLSLLVLILASLIKSIHGSNSREHFSSKTPYEWVHGKDSDRELMDDELYHLNEVDGLACSAVHASAVIRHGARYPGLDDVQEISVVHEKLIAAMEPDINADLYKWVNKFPTNNDKALSALGEEEQEALGKRLGKKLQSLFIDESIENLKFLVSSMQRTKQSASAFFEGLSKVIHDDEGDDFDVEVNDELMRFFDLCKKYVDTVSNNKTAMKEYAEFFNNPKVVTIRDKISDKLGIDKDILTTKDIRLIYLICGYETASFQSSPWCSLLDDEDMIVLEYLGDLKHYYKNGYGHNITREQSCPLLSEIFYMMDETILEIESIEDDEEMESFAVGHFAFGHAETVGPLFAALGLFNDSLPLLASNFDQQENRMWRTSQILPFSANVVFVLYECVPEEAEEIDEADYYLKMLVNEVATKIPGCDELFCPYKNVRAQYQAMIDDCDFKKVCSNPNHDEL